MSARKGTSGAGILLSRVGLSASQITQWSGTRHEGSSRSGSQWNTTRHPDPPYRSMSSLKVTQVTLHVTAAAGFGMWASWSTFNNPHVKGTALEAVRSKGGSVLLLFHTALGRALADLFVRMLALTSIYTLPFRVPVLSDTLAIASVASRSLQTHMQRMVDSVRKVKAVEENIKGLEQEELASDLLKRLLRANKDYVMLFHISLSWIARGWHLVISDGVRSEVYRSPCFSPGFASIRRRYTTHRAR